MGQFLAAVPHSCQSLDGYHEGKTPPTESKSAGSMLRGFTFVVTILMVVQIRALPKVIKIGGLFDTEDEEQELAFRIAADFFNGNREQKPKPRIIAQVERIESGDAFAATKKVCSLLEKGVAAIFGPQDPMTSLHVGSICDEVEVPHIETLWEHKPKRDALTLNMYPSSAMLSKTYLAIIKYLGWENFTLLYEENEGIIRLQNVLKEVEENRWKVNIHKFQHDIPYRKIFWDLKKEHVKTKATHQKIVLDVSRQNLYEVLKQAQQVGMVTEKQQYFITCLDFHTLDLVDFKYSKTNFTALRLVKESSLEYQQLKEAMAAAPYNYTRVLKYGIRTETALMFDAVRKFIFALQELDVGKQVEKFPSISCDSGLAKGSDGTSLINYMKSSNMMGTTGLVTFNGLGVRSVFQLDIIFLHEDGLVELGKVLPGAIVNVTANIKIESPFEPQKFIITTIVSPPYTMLKNSSRGLQGNDQFEGFCMDLVNELSKHLHFNYEIRLVKDSEYGQKRGRRWTGMIGEVMRGEADMAVAGLSISYDREKAVDFTLPFMNTGISILFKKPTKKITSLFSFLSPFSTEVWIYLMGAYFAVSFVMFLFGRLTPYEWVNPHPCRQDDIVVENIFNVRNSLWFNIGSLMQQGSDLIPRAFSTRTIASYWNFFTLIMVSSYTANLAAFLTVEQIIYPFNSATELAKQKKIKYGCLDSGSTLTFFKDSNITLYKEMWKSIYSDPGNLVSDNIKGKEKVYNGNFAFFMESKTIEYITERECSLTQIGGLLDNKGYGIATKKGNKELTSWLSSGILHLAETGVIHTLKEKWWTQKGGGRCADTSKSTSSTKVRELSLGNVGGIFVVLIFGLGAAILIAVLEFRWKLFFWENPNKETFWQRLKKEIKFALTFDLTTKPVPQLKNPESTSESKSSEHSHGSSAS